MDDTRFDGSAAISNDGGSSGGQAPTGPTSQTGLRKLASVVAEVRKALADSATGPLRASYMIVGIVDDWPRHKEESGDLSPDAWLTKTFGRGKGVEWFARRHRAAERLDFKRNKTPLRIWHHEAAVWAFDAIKSDAELEKLHYAVIAATKDTNGGNPLTEAQVVLVASRVLGWARKKRATATTCVRCDKMAAALLAAGLVVPE